MWWKEDRNFKRDKWSTLKCAHRRRGNSGHDSTKNRKYKLLYKQKHSIMENKNIKNILYKV